MKIQSAVRKETLFILTGTGIGTGIMIAAFYGLHRAIPESVPFGLPVVTAGIIGWLVATANFFLMGLAVQKVASTQNEDDARRRMTVSLRYRTMMQLAWAAAALLAPVFNAAAGIIPLFLPSLLIKLRAAGNQRKGESKKEVNA